MNRFHIKVSVKILVILLTLTVVLTGIVPASSLNASVVTFYPEGSEEVLNNPYMGWVPWANGGPYPQPHRLAFVNVSWRDLEPVRGEYAFDELEEEYRFAHWEEAGVKIILIMHMDYPRPYSHMDIPDWLYNETNKAGTWYSMDWGKGFSPDYTNKKLIEYHKELIKALAHRYDNDKRVFQIAIGSLGHWGEFHTKKSRSFTIPFPGTKITDQYVQHYIDSFKHKFLSVRRPFKVAGDNSVGLYNMGFGDNNQTYKWFLDWAENGYTDYLTGEYHPPMPDYWKAAPAGGEFLNYPGLRYMQNNTIETTVQMAKDLRISWLGPSSPVKQPPGSPLQHNFDRLLKTIGYRFVLKYISHLDTAFTGTPLEISMVWENQGSAPFYFGWSLELSLLAEDGTAVYRQNTPENIRTWYPGTKHVIHSLDLPQDLPAGNYRVGAAILDPDTGLPGIRLAIGGMTSDGRYALGNLRVLSSGEETGVLLPLSADDPEINPFAPCTRPKDPYEAE